MEGTPTLRELAKWKIDGFLLAQSFFTLTTETTT